MDWTSQEGRALLWAAYPEGYVALRGVLTVGGWQCVDVDTPSDGDRTSGWRRIQPDAEGLMDLGLLEGLPDARVNAGECLPLPCLEDTATWVCLLREFAEAHQGQMARRAQGSCGFSWVQEWDQNDRAPYWILRVYSRLLAWHSPPYAIDCEDPAEALVRARAALRGP